MNVFHALGNKVLDIVLTPLILAIASLLVGILVRKLKALGLDVDDKQQEQLKKLTVEAIQAVEEQARRDPMPAEEKHAAAVDLLQAKRPDMTTAELSQKVDAVLPEVRAKLAPSTPGNLGRAA